MDEHTLNDLLECSVCLERLDTTSKVLPCQHTFCRKCLEVRTTTTTIVWSSRGMFPLWGFHPHSISTIFSKRVSTCFLIFVFHSPSPPQIIIASHNELRCPECRVLIEIKIDDLPPNVLLMRILGGKIRNYISNIFNKIIVTFSLIFDRNEKFNPTNTKAIGICV